MKTELENAELYFRFLLGWAEGNARILKEGRMKGFVKEFTKDANAHAKKLQELIELIQKLNSPNG